MAEKKEIRVNEKTRVVRAYKDDMKNDDVFKEIEKYKKLGYKAVITNRPKNYQHIKNDMIKYLENNISDDIYLNFIDGVEKKHNFLKLKWELVEALQKEEDKKGKKAKKIKWEDVIDIINQAKSKENNIIQKAKDEATKENEKANNNENE